MRTSAEPSFSWVNPRPHGPAPVVKGPGWQGPGTITTGPAALHPTSQ